MTTGRNDHLVSSQLKRKEEMLKKMLLMISAAVLFLFAIESRAAYLLASKGKTTFSIVLPDDAIKAEETAASELQEHLKEITGVDFPIVKSAEFAGGNRLSVGFTGNLPARLTPENYPDLGVEELVIDADGDTILLAGGRPRGALYAVYEFLERLGVRWYTPTETLIPSIRNLSIEVEPERYTSPFISRTNVLGIGITNAWSARNRLNSVNEWSTAGIEYGNDGLQKQGPDMHTLWRILNPAIFKDHPEWAAYVNGERQVNNANNHWGACLSNEELQNYLIDRTMDWLRQRPGVEAVWFGQNDGSPYCECEACKAIYEAHGGEPSAVIAIILNKLSERVAKEIPDIRVKTLAYSWSLTPPANIRLNDNITVMLCATFSWFSEIGKDQAAEKYLDNVANWQKIGSSFEAYLYGHPTDDFWLPAPCLYSQAHNIKAIRDLGITSIHHEVYGTGTGNGGELAELRGWLYTRLAWRPDSDIEALIEDFCRGYYGQAADEVLYAIHRTEQSHAAGWRPDTSKNVGMIPSYVEPDVVKEIRPRLQKCYDELPGGDIKRRVGMVLLSFLWADYWHNFKGLGKIDTKTNTWGVDFSNRSRSAKEGALIRQLMLDGKVSAIKLGGGAFNPVHLRLAEMTKAYPFIQLKDKQVEITVVPGLYGKMTQLARNGSDILKSLWGHQQFQYPTEGYGRDLFFGHMPESFSGRQESKNSARLTSNMATGEAIKKFSLNDGQLEYVLEFKASQQCKGQLIHSPRFNLNADVFGIYPKLFIAKANGYDLLELGKAGTMWYQAAGIPIDGFAGKMYLIAEDGHFGLEIIIPPKKLGGASYMYDRYDFQPEGSGRMLELSFSSPEKSLSAGSSVSLPISYRILLPEEFPVLP